MRAIFSAVHDRPAEGGRADPMSPSPDDAKATRRLIASAGLPLSVRSLVDYLREGQPQGGGDPRPIREFPPASMTYTASSTSALTGGGGWNVQSDSPPIAPFAIHSPSHPDPGGIFTEGRPNGGEGVDGLPLRPLPLLTANGAPNGRLRGEGEILSNLLHFHASYFPPPPPPRVPASSRRSRAALWYHYASKWDITHRLPPPPHSPLQEMEMEYRMQLPELTRVPYNDEDWLRMCERWFDVLQGLFDYPEDGAGTATRVQTILNNTVTL
ncbi:unnamed protein product [Phytomonas sp. EM1]|nr:unnamed protein product [Phytomonas sp. EM1]|eukprot:CCW65424.1 unnamed protein product [Phytomonas sp. isolate EM1]